MQTAEKSPSKAWYLLPILFSWIGAIIMWFSLKERDRSMAKKGVIIGVILTIITHGFWGFLIPFG